MPSKILGLFYLFLLSLIIPGFSSFLQPYAYQESRAKEFWYYQVASLCDSSRLTNWNVSTVSDIFPNVTDINVFYNSSGSNLAYTAYNPAENLIWMVFRRTVDIINGIEDLDIILSNYDRCEGCQVHQGFYHAYSYLKDDVMNSFKTLKLKYPQAKTAVIGHSLGAAMSTFAFLDVYQETGDLDYFYTFGSPRVGNKEFINYANSILKNSEKVRITHYRDATPHLPLNDMGYYHVGGEVFYNEESSSYQICEWGIEDPSCSMQFGLLELSFQDHVNYMGFDHEVYQQTCQ